MRRLMVCLLIGSMLWVIPLPAEASCTADPNALTFAQMIHKKRTGVHHYPVMFLGKVVTVKDVGGRRGGDTIARLAVAAHPVGFAPLVSRVHFYTPPPRIGVEDNLEFKRHQRYVVIAHRRKDGTFDFDGGCGQTRAVSRHAFQKLRQMARNARNRR